MTDQSGDVWSRATAEDDPHGADECRNCPICRAIALGRDPGLGRIVERRLRDAGRSLLAAALDAVVAFDQARGDRGAEASGGSWAGTSDRSGPSRPEGSGRPAREDAWSSATAGDPTDIGRCGARPRRDA